VGFDRRRGLRDTHGSGITGGRGAVPIWTRFMIRATEGEPSRPFMQPMGVEFRTVEPVNGRTAYPGDPSAIRVALPDSWNAASNPSRGTGR
jgi:membrane carboxypeptidase/penicillin-binding protein